MELFLDTADVSVIKDLAETGLVDGVTTNPSLIAKSGQPLVKTIREITKIVGGPISAEVTATDVEGMTAEAMFLAGIASNVVIKLPLTLPGLQVCRLLKKQGVPTNVTLCFSPGQALMAAKAGATYVSPFIGRVDDLGTGGSDLIAQIMDIYEQYGFETKVLAASVRSTQHVVDAARLGADAVTIPPEIFHKLYKHPLTDSGLKAFLEDWKTTGQSIIS